MILSRRVTLGGVQLDELHEAIVIQSIDPGIPNETVSASDKMGGFGQRITGQHWNMLESSVTFAINVPKREMILRNEILDLVKAWAKAKQWLIFSNMPDRQMYVDKVVLPGPGDLWEWTHEYTITFRAYNVPFWQQITPNITKVNSITNGSVPFEVGGTAPSVLDIAFRNISGKVIQNFAVTAAGKTITLNDVNIGANETLRISHGTDGLLRILSGNRNVYSLYRGSDDLAVNPGSVTVKITATRAGELTVTNTGRFL